MRALDELPGLVLPDAELSLFARMPADSCGIEENLSPLESGQAGRFRIPLIPADQNADPAKARIESPETKVAWCKIIFLVIQRVVRNMHLPIETQQGAVGVEYYGCVVVQAGRPTLEKRSDNHRARFLGRPGKLFGRGAGNGLLQIEQTGVWALVEAGRPEELLQGSDL